MAKKNRTLAGFDDVAADLTKTLTDQVVEHVFGPENDANNDANTNANNDANENVNIDTSVNNNNDTNVNVDENPNAKVNGKANVNVEPEDKPEQRQRSQRGTSNQRTAESQKVEQQPPEDPIEEEEEGSVLDELLGKSTRIEDTHVMRGLYIEKSLDAIITRLAKKGGRGVKSKLVNEALKKLFREKGLL